MEFRLAIEDLQNPRDIVALKNAISMIADECDVLYTEQAPDGVISARVGRRAIYKNGTSYEVWINTDGAKAWKQMLYTDSEAWVVNGTEIQLRTAMAVDMQSKKIISLLDPTADQDASTKAYVDGKFNTTSGHDHDGSDAKKVIYTNLDMTGITSGHILYNNNGTPAGKAEGNYVNPYSDGAYIEAYANTERTTTSASYVKLKEFTPVNRPGTVTVAWQMKDNDVEGRLVYSKVYKNGVAVGSEKSTSNNSYQNETETNISVSAGDVLQIYGKGQEGNTCYIANAKLETANPEPPQEASGY